MDSKTTTVEVEQFLRQGKMVKERHQRTQNMRQRNKMEINQILGQNKLMQSKINKINQVINSSPANYKNILENVRNACKQCQKIINQ